MRLALILVFIAVPLLELAILIKVGSAIGFWPTFAIVVGTALIGTTLLRQQGFRVLQQLSDELAAGRPPLAPLADGAMLLVAGAFLLTPGLITDTLGFLLLIPPVRALVRAALARKLAQSPGIFVDIVTGSSGRAAGQDDRGPDERGPQRRSPFDSGPPGRGGPSDGPVIEGEFERLDEKSRPPRR